MRLLISHTIPLSYILTSISNCCLDIAMLKALRFSMWKYSVSIVSDKTLLQLCDPEPQSGDLRNT